MICQQYISKPFLIDGFKFDLRIYVVVTSCDPLRIFVYKDGLGRFTTVRYTEPSGNNLVRYTEPFREGSCFILVLKKKQILNSIRFLKRGPAYLLKGANEISLTSELVLSTFMQSDSFFYYIFVLKLFNNYWIVSSTVTLTSL